MTTRLEQIISEKYELLKPFLDEQNKRRTYAVELRINSIKPSTV